MTTLTFECIEAETDDGETVQLFRATLGERVTYGRNRAQALDEMATVLRQKSHEAVMHDG